MKYLGGKIFFILGFLLCSGFFCCQNCQAAGSVVINEVAWMGTTVSANNEWIELKNSSGADIDLTGWTLEAADGAPKINLSGAIPANGYFLLERTSDGTVPGVPADLIYSGALGNSGENLQLRDESGNMIDQVDASAGWPAGDNTTKQTMARNADGSWQSSLAPGGTPRAANDGGAADPISNATETPAAEAGGSTVPVYRHGDVLINEFVSDPATGENEWVELYNPSGGKISLAGWTIVDGSGAATTLSGGFNENNYYFFVAEKFKGALNNDGDQIMLYSDIHNLIDAVTYGNFGDHPENNALAPGKGESTVLKADGRKVSLDKDSYVITENPTKGKPNIISAPDNSDAETATSSDSIASDILITEIFPNPVGSDRTGEFIELYNNSADVVDLTGYRIEITGGCSFEFGKFFNLTRQLSAHDFFSLYRPASNLVLDNNGGTVRLFTPGKTRAAQTIQYDTAGEGLSYCDTAYLDLTNSATKKYLVNSRREERWVWSSLPTPGRLNRIASINYPPQLSFSTEGKLLSGQEINFDASDSYDEDGDPLSFNWDFGDSGKFNSESVSHIFSQPGIYHISLSASDGQETSTLDKIIKIGGIAAKQIKNYSAVQSVPIPSSSAVKKNTKTAVIKAPSPKVIVASAARQTSPLSPVSPVKTIDKYKLGAGLKFSGQVLVLPGVFGSQFFYLLIATNSPAVKIYNYYKNFPALKLGDLISVSGTVGGSAADKYLKTKSAADIKIISAGVLPAAEKITAADFTTANLNRFVQADGEVEGKNGAQISLFDGEADFNLYLKPSANLSASALKAGAKVNVSGLITAISGGLAIMPRMQADLAFASSSADAAGQILGAATGSSAWTLSGEENNRSPLIYILISVGAIIIILAGWMLKKYLAAKKDPAPTK